jgi:hypothetical protein
MNSAARVRRARPFPSWVRWLPNRIAESWRRSWRGRTEVARRENAPRIRPACGVFGERNWHGLTSGRRQACLLHRNARRTGIGIVRVMLVCACGLHVRGRADRRARLGDRRNQGGTELPDQREHGSECQHAGVSPLPEAEQFHQFQNVRPFGFVASGVGSRVSASWCRHRLIGLFPVLCATKPLDSEVVSWCSPGDL